MVTKLNKIKWCYDIIQVLVVTVAMLSWYHTSSDMGSWCRASSRRGS